MNKQTVVCFLASVGDITIGITFELARFKQLTSPVGSDVREFLCAILANEPSAKVKN